MRTRSPAPESKPGSFGHLPARYDRAAVLLGAELRGWLLFHLTARGDRTVDLGCGTGVHTAMLAEQYREVLAMDVSGPMVEFARRFRPAPNVTYELRDLRDVEPVADDLFDVVFSRCAPHYVSEVDSALQRVRQLMRSGGRVLVVDLVDERTAAQPVGEQSPPPRSRFRWQAWRAFSGDVGRCPRPLQEAVDVLGLRLECDWLDYLTTDQFLPTKEWEACCSAVFPAASIGPLAGAWALVWSAGGN